MNGVSASQIRKMRRSLRLSKELSQLESEPPPGVSCWMKTDSMDQLQAQIIGGDDSPYSDGVFKLEIQVPERYPMEPPQVRFLTPIYHPNIAEDGIICLDLLKMPPSGSWKPSLNISTLLTSIRLLMSQPNPDDPLMETISAEFKTNHALFKEKAREHTQKHATQQSSTCRTSALSAEHQSNSDDQSESSSDDSDKSDSSSDESTSLLDNLAKRKSSQCSDDQMDSKKFKADNSRVS